MSDNDRPMLQATDACDNGRHKLEPRYDFEKVGSIVKRSYVCDVCVICGHQVPAPMPIQGLLDAGVVDAEEVREAMWLIARNPELHIPSLKDALGVVIAGRHLGTAESNECTGEAPKGA